MSDKFDEMERECFSDWGWALPQDGQLAAKLREVAKEHYDAGWNAAIAMNATRKDLKVRGYEPEDDK